ncbi:MAG: arginine--tRNA ligase [Bacilli bacterium]|nr:arginine--tRNA ligase [Bacilli bacterium]
MLIEEKLKRCLKDALAKMNVDIDISKIVIERSKEKVHGDFASNIAMQLARELKKNPLLIAEDIVNNLDVESFNKVEIARPGFINFFLKSEALSSIIKTIIDEGDNYGSSTYGENKPINVEFVSANPTGDLHLGHARGAAIGDCICRLYSKIGYNVTREFYVNDAGNQINVLGRSIRARYHQLFGDNIEVPEDGYHAPELLKIAEIMKNEVGDKYLVDSEESETYFKRRGTELELDKLNNDLKNFRVNFDVFSFETDIRAAGGVERVLEGAKQYIYENEGATFLKTTAFKDDKDRVIIKSDGSYTYLLPDIAYHLNKLDRGFTQLVDILGADHHGYIDRMKSSLEMFGYPRSILEIELIQMVRLFKNAEEYKMSKRTGNAIAMRELCEEVGVDAVRYFFVNRAASAHLDFDLDLAKESSSANPVYYAQYAYARLFNVLQNAEDIKLNIDGTGLEHQKEIDLMKHLSLYQKEVLDAALTRAPYKVTVYIQKLASLIHGFYTECRLLDRNNLELTSSRLALCKASMIVLKNALGLIGVSAPEKM